MTDGVVIDANVISSFYKEFLDDEGDLYDTINWILVNRGIATSDLIIAEWTATCRNDVLKSWITDNLKLGKIKYVNPELDHSIVKKLSLKYGLPKSRDVEHIKCANVTSTKYILTNDIHFFDPKLHSASQKAKKHAKNERKGQLCIFLRKQLGIIVGIPDHCVDDFCIPCK